MSVIFKTLKKLREQESDGRHGTERLKKRTNLFSLRGVTASSRLVLFLVSFIFICGLLSMFIVEHVRDKKGSVAPTKTIVEKPVTVNAHDGAKVETGKENLPAEPASPLPPVPANMPVETAGTENLYAPRELSPGVPPAKTYAQTSLSSNPPIPLMEKTVAEKEGESTTEQREAAGPPTPISSIVGKETINADATEGTGISIPGETPSQRIRLSRYSRYIPQGSVNKVTTRQVEPGSEAALPKDRSATTPEPFFEDAHNRIYVEKNAKIAGLVKRIQGSINIGSNSKTQALIAKLAVLKGKNDPYVLKLRAFCHMRKGDLDSATFLLKRVIGKNKNDCEAGINMAIIEIETGRTKEARKRLRELRDMHPHNKIIPELLYKLE